MFAPFDWTILNFGLYWPEQIPSYAFTLLGAVYVVVIWRRVGPAPVNLQWPPLPRLGLTIALLMLWIAGPFPFMAEAQSKNLHNTQVLADANRRVGQDITFDRNRVTRSLTGQPLLNSWNGDTFILDGQIPQSARIVSIKGTFTSPNKI